MNVHDLYLLVPAAPLLGAIIVGLFGPKLGRAASHWLCILGVAVAMVASYFIWADVRAGHSFNGDVYTWLQSGRSRSRSASSSIR
jgi:NADH-quinone oxidoreductase subunit L